MLYKSIYEFLVWDNCKNRCKFCFQREEPRLFNHKIKEKILTEVISFIDGDKFVNGSHILVCGGEIFDTPQDVDILNDFFKNIVQRMNDNIIDLLYLNTNLIYQDRTALKNFLDLIKDNNLFERLKFTTSYDIEGRFESQRFGDISAKDVMLNNLKWINENYSDCKIVSNTILTKPACQAILNGTFSMKLFMETYHCWVNLIPYIVLDDTLTASREEIFKALKYVDMENSGYLKKYVPNMSIEQPKLLYMYKNNNFQFCSCPMSECGHSVNFKRYSKSGSCFCCDLKEVFNESL